MKNLKFPRCLGVPPRALYLPESASVPEQRYGAVLEERLKGGQILAWWYEPERFVLTRPCRDTGTRGCMYTPDFRVMGVGGEIWFVETKPGCRKNGKPSYYTKEDSKIKMKMFRELHPFRLVLAYEDKGVGWQEIEV